MALLKYQKKCDTLIERKIIRKNGNYEKIYTDNLLHIGWVYLCSLRDLDLFSEKSGITKANIQRWIPIVAATQMTKGKEEEQEFLSNWINVVDYE